VGLQGWSDEWAYMVGEAVMEPAIDTLNYIPSQTILSKKLPRGMESSVFAFLAGLSNYARMSAALSGAILFDLAGVKTVTPCNFEPLWWLVIVCHVLPPMTFGVAFSFLMPNKKQNEEL
jgi:hypothetical protein